MARGKAQAAMAKSQTASRPKQPRTPFVLGEEWNQWRREAAAPEYATRALEIMHSATHVSRQRYLEMMYDMEADFPGRGWKEQGADLYGWFYKRGLSLKEIPKSSMGTTVEV